MCKRGQKPENSLVKQRTEQTKRQGETGRESGIKRLPDTKSERNTTLNKKSKIAEYYTAAAPSNGK